mgnify:CR=1 FL=1
MRKIEKEQLEKVREIALLYLHIPIEKTSSELVVSHPFTNSNIVASQNMRFLDLYVPSERQVWEEQMEEQIKKSSLKGIYMLLDKRYFFSFLNHTEKYLDAKMMAKVLACRWQQLEYISNNTVASTHKILKWFRFADKKELMDEEEYQKFLNLPEKITIYRGVSGYNRRYKKAVSWTLNRELAEWFAERWENDEQEVWEVTVPKECILCYFQYEDEVIVDLTKIPYSQYKICKKQE